MAPDTRSAAPLEPAAPSAATGLCITARREIDALLRELCDAATPVVLSGPDGASLTTSLWSIDAHTGRASFHADAPQPQMQRLVDADEIFAVAYLDKVKLQFDVREPIVVHGARSCMLQTQLPSAVYRFQRRSSYRVQTAHRRMPAVRLRHPSIPDMGLALRILDVSIGGCALLLPDDVPPLQAGTRLPQVQVELDAETRFAADIMLHHISSGSEDSGHRLGCEWQQLEAAAQRTLQRFIDNTQRRQRLLSAG